MEAVKKKMRTLKGKLDEAEAACKKPRSNSKL